jgi:hypothetical protein
MAGARRGENRPWVARIGEHVMDDVAEELRPGELPRTARGVGGQRPQSLARRDQ